MALFWDGDPSTQSFIKVVRLSPPPSFSPRIRTSRTRSRPASAPALEEARRTHTSRSSPWQALSLAHGTCNAANTAPVSRASSNAVVSHAFDYHGRYGADNSDEGCSAAMRCQAADTRTHEMHNTPSTNTVRRACDDRSKQSGASRDERYTPSTAISRALDDCKRPDADANNDEQSSAAMSYHNPADHCDFRGWGDERCGSDNFHEAAANYDYRGEFEKGRTRALEHRLRRLTKENAQLREAVLERKHPRRVERGADDVRRQHLELIATLQAAKKGIVNKSERAQDPYPQVHLRLGKQTFTAKTRN